MAIPEGGKGPWGAPTLLDVPFDQNSSYLRGAATAPPLIRDALTCESSNMWSELGVDVGTEGAYADGGAVEPGASDRFASAGTIPLLIQSSAPLAATSKT